MRSTTSSLLRAAALVAVACMVGAPQRALAAPDFKVQVSPGKVSVVPGSVASFTVSIGPKGGFNANVVLSIAGLPAGATASFSPASFVPLKNAKTSTLTITTSAATPTGTYALPVTVTGGGLTHSDTANLVVKNAKGSAGSFTIAATPSAQTVHEGEQAQVTVTLTSVNGFSSAVALTISGLPAGATASFSPGAVTPTGTGANSTLTITTTDPMPLGPIVLTVTGTSGALSNQASVSLDVTASVGNAPPGIYVADPINAMIWHIDDMTGANLVGLPINGTPLSVTVGPDNHIYVAARDHILRFDDMTGRNMKSFGTSGTGVNQFGFAREVAVGPDLRIYVADEYPPSGADSDGRIVRFDDFSGANWTTYVGPPYYFRYFFPTGVSIAPDGRIWFSEYGGYIGSIDDMTGANFSSFGGYYCSDRTFVGETGIPFGFCGPNRVHFYNGNPLIADTRNDRIALVAGGAFYSYGGFAGQSSGPGLMNDANGVIQGQDGRIYIATDQFIARIDDIFGTGWTTYAIPGAGSYYDVFVK